MEVLEKLATIINAVEGYCLEEPWETGQGQHCVVSQRQDLPPVNIPSTRGPSLERTPPEAAPHALEAGYHRFKS